MRPSRTRTSAVNAGAPVPSTTIPPRIRIWLSMGIPLQMNHHIGWPAAPAEMDKPVVPRPIRVLTACTWLPITCYNCYSSYRRIRGQRNPGQARAVHGSVGRKPSPKRVNPPLTAAGLRCFQSHWNTIVGSKTEDSGSNFSSSLTVKWQVDLRQSLSDQRRLFTPVHFYQLHCTFCVS